MIRILVALGVAAAGGLAACAMNPPPADRYYRIEPAAPGLAREFSSRVLVENVESAGMYAERPLVFQREEAGGALEQYHYHFWSESPDLLLTDALVRYLRAALGAGQVFGAGSRVDPDLIVRARLRKLDHRLAAGAVRSVLAVQFTITDARRNAVSVVDFEESAPAGNGAPAEHVQTLNQLSAQAFARLAEQLVRAGAPGADADKKRSQ